jgi:hypothetical protein
LQFLRRRHFPRLHPVVNSDPAGKVVPVASIKLEGAEIEIPARIVRVVARQAMLLEKCRRARERFRAFGRRFRRTAGLRQQEQDSRQRHACRDPH